MSKVDWSLAPEWATGYAHVGMLCHPVWFDADRYEYILSGMQHRFEDGCTFKFSALSDIIKRPQPKPWSGPEDGLPPVGTVCELRTKRGGWGEAEIKYQGRRGICVWLWVRRDGNSEQVEWAESPDKLEFRAIRTPAQIASEKRETAIRELMDIAQVDCRVTAARLVDAGFKR
jgi:hypothetical protein